MSNPTNPADGGAANANPGGAGGAAAGAVTFTAEQQAHIDRIAAEARKAGRNAAGTDLLKELGVEKIDDAKAALTEHKALKAEKLSEAEKAKLEADNLKAQLAQEKAEREAAQAEANEERMRTAVLSEASATFTDPTDAWAFIERAKLTLEGKTVKGAKEAVAEVAKAKPHLLKATGTQTMARGGTPRSTVQAPPAGGNEDRLKNKPISF